MATISNVDLITTGLQGNVGTMNYLEPEVINTVILVPRGMVIAPQYQVDVPTLSAYLTSLAHDEDYADRIFILTGLDNFQEKTKETATDDRGLTQLLVQKFNPLYMWDYMANMGNFIELLKFHQKQDLFDVYLGDTSGVLIGAIDTAGTGGLSALRLAQLFVMDQRRKTATKNAVYSFSLQFENRQELNDYYGYLQGPIDFDSIAQFQNLVMYDVTPQATSILTSALGVGGTGYAVNDTFTINTGQYTAATGIVTAVSSGVVTAFTILTTGGGYTAGTLATTATSGSGTGLTITVTVIIPTTLTTTRHFAAKSAGTSFDWEQRYASVLTAPCFRAYNLTSGANAPITSIVAGEVFQYIGQTINAVKMVLTSAPASGAKVQFSIQPPATLAGILNNSQTPVVIDGYPGITATGAPICTFA